MGSVLDVGSEGEEEDGEECEGEEVGCEDSGGLFQELGGGAALVNG